MIKYNFIFPVDNNLPEDNQIEAEILNYDPATSLIPDDKSIFIRLTNHDGSIIQVAKISYNDLNKALGAAFAVR
jgi:hypothetical protein